MARIPSEQDFGPRPVPQGQRPIVSDQSGEIRGQAMENFGNTVTQIGNQIDEKGQELARAKDANNYIDHQIAVKQLEQTYKDKIASGELPYQQAQQQFTLDAAKIPAPTPNARGQIAAENLTRGVQRSIQSASFGIGQAANVARDQDLRSQGAMQLDSLGKLAGLPDADIDSVNKQAELVGPLLRQSGMNEAQVSHTLQEFKDRNWFNRASQTAMQSRDNLPALKQMEHDLTAADGFYAGRMDTDKRNTVLSQVINHRLQLENKLQHEGDKRDAMAERAVNEMDRQIASTVPATAEQWADWQQTTKGTASEPLFKQLRANEVEVQTIVKQPIEDQLKFVQDKQSELLAHGGDLREAANVQRLSNAVNQNIKLLQTDPLQFNAARTGADVAPVDFAQANTPEGAGELAKQLASRVTTLQAMRKQYGFAVPLRPFLPQEAKQLSAGLQSMEPHDAVNLLSGLQKSLGSNEAYQGAMQQIAPDSPVIAHAGLLAAEQAQLTTKSHWFKADDQVANADVAATMLQGERLLNPSKGDKAQDGKPKLSLYLPEQKSLQDEFASEVKTAFANSPAAAENAFQAVKAYYVGRAEQKGVIAQATSGKADPDLVEEAVKATLGNVVNYNGRGAVIAPWGMSESGFNDRAQLAFTAELAKRGMPSTLAQTLPSLGLRNYGDGTYQVVQGNNVMSDHQGRPIVLNLNTPIDVKVEVPRGRARGSGVDYVTKQK